MQQKNPTVIIRNNTGAAVPVILFPFGGNPTSNNALTQYKYDISAEMFVAASKLSIQVKGSSSQPFRTITANLSPANAQGVVNVLNGLNLGTSWYVLQSGGSTFIVTNNDTLIFGQLTIFAPNQIPAVIEEDMSVAQNLATISYNGRLIYSANGTGAPVDTFTNFIPGITLDITVSAANIIFADTHYIVLKNGVITVFETIFQGDTRSFTLDIESDATDYAIFFSHF